MELSLLYFSAGRGRAADEYERLIEYARFADRRGFAAVWIPERHFTVVGSLFPNPATIHAAIARETTRIALRAGSVVLPLHDPKRVAEEWAVVDHLSRGRVGVSFAVGWHPNDFAFFPDRYAGRYEDFAAGVRAVQRLWQGQAASARNGAQQPVNLVTYPRPLQPELPTWITAAGDPRTFRQAGLLGANLLTHLFSQTIDELAGKLAIYRDALTEVGEDPRARTVTVMLHTHVHAGSGRCPAYLMRAFREYLRGGAQELLPALQGLRGGPMPASTSEADVDAGVDRVVQRLIDGDRVLFGDPEACTARVRKLRALGVTEIACQVDFGLTHAEVMAGLERLDDVRVRCLADEEVGLARPSAAPTVSPATGVALAAARQRCRERLPDATWRKLLAAGVTGGARIESLTRSSDEFVAEISAASSGDGPALARVLCELAAFTPIVLAGARTGAEIGAIASYELFGGRTPPRWIHCECPDAADLAPAIVSATAYDASGLQLATLTGVELLCEGVGRTAAQIETFTTVWTPVPAPDSGRLIPKSLLSEQPATEPDPDVIRYRDHKQVLDQLSSAAIVDALAAAGVRFDLGAPIVAEEVVTRAGITAHRLRQFRRFLDLLVADGTLAGSESMLHVARQPTYASFDEAIDALASAGSTFGAELELLRLCAPRLGEALRGQVSGVDVLFSGSGFEVLSRFYREAAFAPRLNAVLGESVARYADALGRPARVIEIGAGTGATTECVLTALGNRDFSYAVTDVSVFFVHELERRLESDRRLTFKMLDVERRPDHQGFAPHGADVVIAANVLHATAAVAASLEHVHRLLAPNGLLVLLELTSPEPMIDVVFGLLPGFWRFEDDDRRSYPLLDRDRWSAALESGGFGAVEMWPGAGANLPASVIVARPAPQRLKSSSHYVILCDDRAAGERMQLPLRELGHRTMLLPAADSLLQIDDIVSREPETNLVVVAEMTHRAERIMVELPARLLSIVKRIESGNGVAIPVAIVTTGCLAVDGESATEDVLVGGALSAFARAVNAALGSCSMRLIDLDPAGAPAENAAWLARQLETGEPAITALRGAVAYTPKLASVTLPDDCDGSVVMKADSTYLVTGGTGGVGAEIAMWLAERGARHVALLTRPSAYDERARREARAQDVRARLQRCGATACLIEIEMDDEDQVRRAVRQLEHEGFPPIAGVVHAAGTLLESQLIDLSSAAFVEVMATKALGAYILHKVLGDRALDFFVLCSSLAALFPAPNQAAYSAANGALDALAVWSRALGRQTVSVGWGPWRGIGYGATPAGRAAHARLAASGIETLAASEATRSLGQALQSGLPYVAIARLNRERLSTHSVAWLPDLAARDQPLPISATDAEGLCDLLAAELSRLTATGDHPFPRDIALSQLGLDSLLMLQFTAQLQRRFRLRLSLEDTDLSLTLIQLAERLSVTAAAGTGSLHSAASGTADGESPR